MSAALVIHGLLGLQNSMFNIVLIGGAVLGIITTIGIVAIQANADT